MSASCRHGSALRSAGKRMSERSTKEELELAKTICGALRFLLIQQEMQATSFRLEQESLDYQSGLEEALRDFIKSRKTEE